MKSRFIYFLGLVMLFTACMDDDHERNSVNENNRLELRNHSPSLSYNVSVRSHMLPQSEEETELLSENDVLLQVQVEEDYFVQSSITENGIYTEITNIGTYDYPENSASALINKKGFHLATIDEYGKVNQYDENGNHLGSEELMINIEAIESLLEAYSIERLSEEDVNIFFDHLATTYDNIEILDNKDVKVTRVRPDGGYSIVIYDQVYQIEKFRAHFDKDDVLLSSNVFNVGGDVDNPIPMSNHFIFPVESPYSEANLYYIRNASYTNFSFTNPN